MTTGNIEVSVVIPTRNRSALLARVLESLTMQLEAPPFEIIVIDNGSSDETATVCRNALTELPNIEVLYDARPGLHIGRNLALEAAKGGVLLYCDDDVKVSSTWIKAMAEAFEDEGVGIATGPCVPDYESRPPVWVPDLKVPVLGGWYIAEFSLLDLGDRSMRIDPSLVFGCNFAARRRLIQSVGGFHPDALPRNLLRFRGDGETAVAEAISRVGFDAVYAADAVVEHRVPTGRMTMDYIEHRNYAEGVTASYRSIRYTNRSLNRFASHLHALRTRTVSLKTRSEIVRRRSRAQVAGYLWHQAQVRSDPALLDWVRRNSYLGPNGDLSQMHHDS